MIPHAPASTPMPPHSPAAATKHRWPGVLALALSLAGSPAAAQVTPRAEALDEIRSLDVAVSVSGAGAPAGLSRELREILLQELERTAILDEIPPPRPGDCCVLRLDVRLATSRAATVYGTGYTLRLDLGFPERVGRVEAWVLLWHGSTQAGVVDPAELAETLRARAREQAVEFTQRYRERFPPRR